MWVKILAAWKEFLIMLCSKLHLRFCRLSDMPVIQSFSQYWQYVMPSESSDRFQSKWFPKTILNSIRFVAAGLNLISSYCFSETYKVRFSRNTLQSEMKIGISFVSKTTIYIGKHTITWKDLLKNIQGYKDGRSQQLLLCLFTVTAHSSALVW